MNSFFYQIKSCDNLAFYLCVLKKQFLLIAVKIDPNCGPITACPTESVDDSRAIREDNPQSLQRKEPETLCPNPPSHSWLALMLKMCSYQHDHWIPSVSEHSITDLHLSVFAVYLVPGDGAVHWVCVLKDVCFFHLKDLILHSKPLLHESLVCNHDLQIFHHITRCIDVDILIVVPEDFKKDLFWRCCFLQMCI